MFDSGIMTEQHLLKRPIIDQLSAVLQGLVVEPSYPLPLKCCEIVNDESVERCCLSHLHSAQFPTDPRKSDSVSYCTASTVLPR